MYLFKRPLNIFANLAGYFSNSLNYNIEKVKDYKLLSAAGVGSITLKNRMVMSPMTRCRAIGNIPNDLMAAYYKQRAGAGLILTEGTSPPA
jgi:2,4-dienoyl-CoA reductase-like NADH-dependent reductase (Old Yellow Enzyme family)